MRVVIPIFDRLTALDAVGPYEVLSRLPGAEVVFAAEERRVHRTRDGMLGLEATATLAEARDADVLCVPGGRGTRDLLDHAPLLDWLRTAHAQSTWTTSVCTGSLLLAAAGILDGLEATTHWAAMDELERLGARPVGRRVVEQGKIMTAAGVSAGIDMALTLAARIAGEEVARDIQLQVEYDPDPPFPLRAPA